MTTSAFDINIIPVSGQQLIASATAANRIVILGACSKDTAATDAEDLASKGLAWFDGAAGEILSCSADNGTSRILVRFTGSDDTGAQTLASVCILAKLANADDSTAVILAASSDTTGKITIPGSSTQFVKVPVNISFSDTSVVQVVEASAAAPSDLLRFVSCHKAGDTESGEDQVIWGEKTFKTRVDFDGDVHANSSAQFSGYVEMYDGLYVEGEVSLADDVTISGALLSGNVAPITNDAKDIGTASNKWRYVYCNYCLPTYLGLTSNRVANAFISNAYCTNLVISSTLTAGTNSNAKNILIAASMSGGSLQITRLDNAVANIPVYNAISGVSISGSVASVPVGSLVLAYIPLSAGAQQLYPGSTLQVGSAMACHIAIPAGSASTAPYLDTGVSLPTGYYRLIHGVFTDSAWSGGDSHFPVLLQRIADSEV